MSPRRAVATVYGGEVAFLDHLKVVAEHSCSFSSSQSISTEQSAAFLAFSASRASCAAMNLRRRHLGRPLHGGVLDHLLGYHLTLHLFHRLAAEVGDDWLVKLLHEDFAEPSKVFRPAARFAGATAFSVVYPGRRLSGNRTALSCERQTAVPRSSIREPVDPSVTIWRSSRP
jgi:hypothetical protein